MRVAFYAPMKPPDHPVPSGDRRMARAFMACSASLGHEVELASRLRSYDRRRRRRPAAAARAAGPAAGGALSAALSASGTAPDLWFTYHLYHKAPDWLGPSVSRALRIPYVVAEASVAGKQAAGPWAAGYAASRAAIAQADLVLAMTQQRSFRAWRDVVSRPTGCGCSRRSWMRARSSRQPGRGRSQLRAWD